MAAGILPLFQDLSPDEQAVLKQAIIALYSVAATSVSTGTSDNTVEVLLAGILNPRAVFSAFLPMAVAFLAIFAFWRRFLSRGYYGIPQGPGYTLTGSIVLIDVFGTHYILQLDRCRSWDVSIQLGL